MNDTVIPSDLVQKCLAIVKERQRGRGAGDIPKRIATKRNAVAAAVLPEAFAALQAATAMFRIRLFLWALAVIALGVSLLLTWWFVFAGAAIVGVERLLAARECRLWMLSAAILTSADILVADFDGWGTAYPSASKAATQALGPDGTKNLEWLENYISGHSESSANCGPGQPDGGSTAPAAPPATLELLDASITNLRVGVFARLRRKYLAEHGDESNFLAAAILNDAILEKPGNKQAEEYCTTKKSPHRRRGIRSSSGLRTRGRFLVFVRGTNPSVIRAIGNKAAGLGSDVGAQQ